MTRQEKYARLLIEVGLNVQKGQDLIISCPIECAPFARMCADAAYDVGCREVTMNWVDEYLTRQRFFGVSRMAGAVPQHRGAKGDCIS